MATNSLLTNPPYKKVNPLSLLARLTNLEASKCLKISNGSTAWSIYIDHGKLIYAASSINPFGRLDNHLRRLNVQANSQISGSLNQVWVKARPRFEVSWWEYPLGARDYQAICWLVQQEGLKPTQAAKLIEALAEEVLTSLLGVAEGTCELVEQQHLHTLPKLCQLDLRTLIDSCQSRLHQQWLSAELRVSQSTSSFKQDKACCALNGINQLASRLPNAQSLLANPLQKAFQQDSDSQFKIPYKIACIDDSLAALKTIDAFLDNQIFKVVGMTNSVSALMQIIRTKPDLIFLDAAMPNLDGYELCSLLRQHAMLKQIPIIMATENNGFIDRLKTKFSGASASLVKPYTQSDLLELIGKFLS